MPKIFEYFGIIFYFFSKDHEPIHVHASHGDFESKLEFVYKNGKFTGISVKTVKGHRPLPPSILKQAKDFAVAKESQIFKKWGEFYGKHKSPAFERITKKI